MLETDKQKIINTVVRHVLEQGEPSVIVYDYGVQLCAYMSPDGLKCAIGALIPDALYREEFEKCSIRRLLRDYPEIFEDWEQLRPFLKRIQSAHDLFSRDTIETWRKSFKNEMLQIAYSEGLECPDFNWNSEPLSQDITGVFND